MPRDVLLRIQAEWMIWQLTAPAATCKLMQFITKDRLNKMAILKKYGIKPNCIHVDLKGKQIDDGELAALCEACSMGAFPNIQCLILSKNQIGDIGMQALAQACIKGAFTSLVTLKLNGNKIGNTGFSTLAHTFAKGQLSKCTDIDMSCNNIDDEGLLLFSVTLGKKMMARCRTFPPLILCAGGIRESIPGLAMASLAFSCTMSPPAQWWKLNLVGNNIDKKRDYYVPGPIYR